jgi:hypothetical protein
VRARSFANPPSCRLSPLHVEEAKVGGRGDIGIVEGEESGVEEGEEATPSRQQHVEVL